MALKVDDLRSEVKLWQGQGPMIDMLNKMKATDYLLMIAQ